MLLCALFAGVIAPHSPYEQYREFTLTPPVWHAGGRLAFILGTDPVGRDMLSRLIYGTRLSLLIGLISVAISLSLGVVLGLVAGYLRGWIETLIMRLMDVMLALPSLLLAIAVVAILGPGADQRHVRDRDRAAAALRAPDARRGDRRRRARNTSSPRRSPAPARCASCSARSCPTASRR